MGVDVFMYISMCMCIYICVYVYTCIHTNIHISSGKADKAVSFVGTGPHIYLYVFVYL